VGIMASPAVRRVGLFDRALADRGVTAIHPDRDDDTLAILRRIKAGDSGPGPRAALAAVSAALQARGAAVQMVACTEFSLIAGAVARGVTALDTLDVLVRAIVDFVMGGLPDGR
ncbi:MAG: aspartate/glutamate racemase family protein, partial [Rhodobacterales bacterium]|nr:aspartate/glutamate racemase family protein [Rhodobacterales bacterium]